MADTSSDIGRLKEQLNNPETIWSNDKAADLAVQLSKNSSWRLVKKNAVRAVYRIQFSADAAIYLKHQKQTAIVPLFNCAVRNRSSLEFDSAQQLQKSGLPIPRHFGWGKCGRDYFLLIDGVEKCRTFDVVWQEVQNDLIRREQFLRDCGTFLGAFVSARVYHRDLHTGNILVDSDVNDFRFHLIDAYGASAGKVNMQQSLNCFAPILVALGPFLSAADVKSLFCLVKPQADPDTLLAERNQLLSLHAGNTNRKWRKRRRRLLQSSSLSTEIRLEDGFLLQRKAPQAPDIEELVELHNDNLRKKQNLVKIDKKRRLTRVPLGARSYIVKEFTTLSGRPFLMRSDRQSWLNAYRLCLFQIPTAFSYAWMVRKKGSSYIVMEDLGELTLEKVLKNNFFEKDQLEDVLKNAARLVAWLHNMGVYHRDLNVANFMCDTSGSNLSIIDYDAIRFLKSILPTAKRERNLQQISELLALHNKTSLDLFLNEYRIHVQD